MPPARAALALLLLASAAHPGPAAPPASDRSCATVLLARGEELFVGHNLDEAVAVPGLIVANPRGLAKESRSQRDLLVGLWGSSPRLRWVSRLGSLTYNVFGREFPDGGLNEAGLYVGEMTLLATEWPSGPGPARLYQHQWVQYLLDTFGTVEEVLSSLEKAVPEGHCRWHFFLADRTGDAAVVEFLKGKPVVYRGETLPFPVLGNDPYQVEVDELRKLYRGFGDGDKDPLPRYPREDPRFRWAAVMLREDDPGIPALDRTFAILERMSFPSNRWKVVYDVRTGRMHVRTSVSPQPRHVDLSAFDFSCTETPLAVDVHSRAEGDLRPAFAPLTAAANRQAVEAAWDEIDAGLLGNLFFKPRMWRSLASVAPRFRCAAPPGSPAPGAPAGAPPRPSKE